jgi:hypothetical protein
MLRIASGTALDSVRAGREKVLGGPQPRARLAEIGRV